MENKLGLSSDDFQNAKNKEELLALIEKKNKAFRKVKKTISYNEELRLLQIELVKLQRWISKNQKRVAIIFEGRDAAGKGGNIRRFMEHLNPRSSRLVALNKPTEVEKGQWYFQRYIKELPNPGEIVFFDRSWYNRAVVEPVNGFCTQEEYNVFMNQVNEFERMILESGIHLVKIYMSISKKEQAKRFADIKSNPLKQWKMSKLDETAQDLWNNYTEYKNAMFDKTNTKISPWRIIQANRKTSARIEAIQHILKRIPYDKNLAV